jgi:uncharacterized membrane protein
MGWPEIHGAVTHFPVGLITAAAIFEIAGRVCRKTEWRTTALWSLALGVLMALPAIAAGLMTARSLYSAGAWPVTLRMHVACAGTATVFGLLAVWTRYKAVDPPKWLPLVFLLLAAVAVGATGYFGGRLALS